jgi:RNA polymerase sigma factor (TIGR02999 family)
MGVTDQLDTTQTLLAARRGDEAAANRLLPLVYDELHALAQRLLRREPADLTLQPTALVHEAYLKLINQTRVEWQDRTHFFAIAAQAMRRILVDAARGRQATKRGEGWQKITLDDAVAVFPQRDVELLALDDALCGLSDLDQRQAQVVQMRFFGGLTTAEAAEVLRVSTRTVEDDWRLARAWLRRELSRSDKPHL